MVGQVCRGTESKWTMGSSGSQADQRYLYTLPGSKYLYFFLIKEQRVNNTLSGT